ncbi:MAG: leucine-rich repeat domain-containing protein [Oscillospiraceae bacterium]|nr:leucine-rich repeat domain-containing protein [Oscillospiraceae bacterium]MBQ9905950.1 leucine-rich repeat domain-containing protein [Oscillospiraceae bacterium]MCR4760271.1 leucine-rich repeat domain-containing protein [Oscillospiraceae bacterium]
MGFFRRQQTAPERVKYRYRDRVERGEFRGREMSELEMPDSVLVIGESGFRECRKLSRVSLSNSVCEIGAYAFRDCDKLENILMPGEMRYPDGSGGMIGIGCFEGCGLLREITIPEGVTVIGANAFHNCAALESVTLPRSLRAIRSGAFSGCARLKTLRVASMPELIALDAFVNTPQQERIAEIRKPVLTIMHTKSYGLPEIYQFSALPHQIGNEQTERDMSVMLDACDPERVCFRITQYQHAGGRHTVLRNQPVRLFYEEYDCSGRVGTHKEEIIATYR